MDKHTIVIIILVFLFLGSTSFSIYAMTSEEETFTVDTTSLEQERLRLEQEKEQLKEEKKTLEKKLASAEEQKAVLEVEKDSPFDHVNDKQVKVFKNKIEIDLKDVEWWTIADTNSMDPLIDEGSTALSIKPASEESIHLGDVAFYDSLIAERVIIHRVIKISSDEKGWFSKFKGDNLIEIDPEDVRFPQVKGVMIGVIY